MFICISDEIREELKQPMGKFVKEDEIKSMYEKGVKIIAVGDISVINLIENDIKPFIAIFDLKTKRQPLTKEPKNMLLNHFKNHINVKNPKSTINVELFNIAKSMINSGGTILVEGEEDLVAIPFIRYMKEDMVLIYGMMGKGSVLIKKDCKKCNEIIKKIIKSSRTVKDPNNC